MQIYQSSLVGMNDNCSCFGSVGSAKQLSDLAVSFAYVCYVLFIAQQPLQFSGYGIGSEVPSEHLNDHLAAG